MKTLMRVCIQLCARSRRLAPCYVFLLFSLLISAINVSVANAYVVDQRLNTSIPTYTDAFPSQYTGPGWVSRLRDAILEWNTVSSTEGWFFWYKYVATSQNVVTAADLRGDPSCQLASGQCLANTYKYGSPYSRFEIKVNIGPGYAFYDGSQASVLPSNYYDLRTILRHELGHAAGICHSKFPIAVMKPSFSTGEIVVVQADDRNALRYLYKPGYNLTQPSELCYGV